jgi:predicted RNase H-like nuclease (RuvC/YqgF family)
MKTKTEITYMDMVQGLQAKIHECRIEIEALKEEQQIAVEDFGQDGKDYDRWIEEQHWEIKRLHKMIRNLQEVYREVR